MLTPNELYGLKNILDFLPENELIALANTITKRLLSISGKIDAIEAIFACVEKPSDLLKRQKISKKVLFNYLYTVRPSISAECAKHELVKICLEEWKSLETCQVGDYEDMCTDEVSVMPISLVPPEIASMGVQFSQWFFTCYNNLSEFGPEHFWLDCTLKAQLLSSSDNLQIEQSGPEPVVSFLSSLILIHKFFFHANDADGAISCEQEAHGLVRIAIQGVVHQLSNCVGLFESIFGLVKNPAFDNNWKIKYMKLDVQINYNPQRYIDR